MVSGYIPSQVAQGGLGSPMAGNVVSHQIAGALDSHPTIGDQLGGVGSPLGGFQYHTPNLKKTSKLPLIK